MQIPGILYGTAWKKDDTERLVTMALSAGFRGVDTACQPKHYHEGGVGAGIAASGLARDELYVQTKFTPLSGQDPARVPYDPHAGLAEQVRQSFEVSLRNLRTSYLDGLVLHSPLPTMKQTAQVWRAMESLVLAGGVRSLGISNCYELERLQELCGSAQIRPTVLQNRFHAETGYDHEIRDYCREHGIVYQSFWTLTANPYILTHAVITDLATAKQRTPAQILFRYLTHRGVVPLTGTRSAHHMRADLEIFEFELTAAELIGVDALFLN